MMTTRQLALFAVVFALCSGPLVGCEEKDTPLHDVPVDLGAVVLDQGAAQENVEGSSLENGADMESEEVDPNQDLRLKLDDSLFPGATPVQGGPPARRPGDPLKLKLGEDKRGLTLD